MVAKNVIDRLTEYGVSIKPEQERQLDLLVSAIGGAHNTRALLEESVKSGKMPKTLDDLAARIPGMETGKPIAAGVGAVIPVHPHVVSKIEWLTENADSEHLAPSARHFIKETAKQMRQEGQINEHRLKVCEDRIYGRSK